jgi:hypothetical protein
MVARLENDARASTSIVGGLNHIHQPPRNIVEIMNSTTASRPPRINHHTGSDSPASFPRLPWRGIYHELQSLGNLHSDAFCFAP